MYTTYAYNNGVMMVGLIEKEEIIVAFDTIYAASSVKPLLTTAREDSSLWKDLQQVFNVISRRITILNQFYQVHLVDDDKEYFESANRAVYDIITINQAKHIRDNRYRHVIHTMSTDAAQLATCVKYEEVGEANNKSFDDMTTKILFDHNTRSDPDLTGLILGYNT